LFTQFFWLEDNKIIGGGGGGGGSFGLFQNDILLQPEFRKHVSGALPENSAFKDFRKTYTITE